MYERQPEPFDTPNLHGIKAALEALPLSILETLKNNVNNLPLVKKLEVVIKDLVQVVRGNYNTTSVTQNTKDMIAKVRKTADDGYRPERQVVKIISSTT